MQKAKTAADAIKIAQEYVLADYAKGVHRTLRYHGKPEDLLDWSKPYVSSQIMTAPMGENCYQGLFWSVHFRPHERLVTPFNTAIFPAENVTDADDPYMPNEYQINVSEIGDAVFVTLAVD